VVTSELSSFPQRPPCHQNPDLCILLVGADRSPQFVELKNPCKVPVEDLVRHPGPSEPHNPAHLALPDLPLSAKPPVATDDLTDTALRILLCIHTQLLAVRQPALVLGGKRLHVRVGRQVAVRPRNVGLDSTSYDIDDADTKRCKLDAQSVCVGVQRSLGRVVRRAPRVGQYAGYGSRLDYRALGLNQEWRELAAHVHDGEDVRLEEFVQLVCIVVQRRHHIVSPSVVVENVELSACDLGDSLAQFADRLDARELEGKVGYAGVRRRVFGWVADGSKDLEAYDV
jgi:hypothetical protein